MKSFNIANRKCPLFQNYNQGKTYTYSPFIFFQSNSIIKLFHSIEIRFRLHELGQDVGSRIIDLHFVRERISKREIKLTQMLLFIKSTIWKSLFGREAEKLEHANDDDSIYYIIEKQPLVNTYISVPKDKGSLNCASYTAGIVEGILVNGGFVSFKCFTQYICCLHQIIIYISLFFPFLLFICPQPCKVTAHWHKGTTYMIKFEDFVISRDKQLDDK